MAHLRRRHRRRLRASHGEVRLKSFCAEPAAIAGYGPLVTEDGRELRRDARAPAYRRRLRRAALAARSPRREAAEALKGTRLYAPPRHACRRLPRRRVLPPARGRGRPAGWRVVADRTRRRRALGSGARRVHDATGAARRHDRLDALAPWRRAPPQPAPRIAFARRVGASRRAIATADGSVIVRGRRPLVCDIRVRATRDADPTSRGRSRR